MTQFVGRLSAAGLSPKPARNVHAVLGKAMADALDLGSVSALTLALYSHVLPADDQAAADSSGSALDAAMDVRLRSAVTNL